MRTFLSLKTCLLSALLLCVNSISASKVISVSDFGLKPDSRINAVPFIQKAIDACKQHPGSTLVFPKGRYDFWAQHAIEKDYYDKILDELKALPDKVEKLLEIARRDCH